MKDSIPNINWEQILNEYGFVHIPKKSKIIFQKVFYKIPKENHPEYTSVTAEVIQEKHVSLTVERFTNNRLKTIIPGLVIYNLHSFQITFNAFIKTIEKWQKES